MEDKKELLSEEHVDEQRDVLTGFVDKREYKFDYPVPADKNINYSELASVLQQMRDRVVFVAGQLQLKALEEKAQKEKKSEAN